jgi:hypothetical protein
MSVVKFQYMPGGQGGGGGWAVPTAGEVSSISGRTANTTADAALRSNQGLIGAFSRSPSVSDPTSHALRGGSNDGVHYLHQRM